MADLVSGARVPGVSFSNVLRRLGQIVQRLCRVRFRHVPYFRGYVTLRLGRFVFESHTHAMFPSSPLEPNPSIDSVCSASYDYLNSIILRVFAPLHQFFVSELLRRSRGQSRRHTQFIFQQRKIQIFELPALMYK